jgi:TfoX/Sxy family transcriptional regulator of competence genes
MFSKKAYESCSRNRIVRKIFLCHRFLGSITTRKMFGSFAFHIMTFQSCMASGETLSTVVTNHLVLTKKKIKQN